MLSGATDSIRIEPPGLEKAEFVVTRGSVRELHQAKRSIPSGSWTIARLSSDGLLPAIGSTLNGNRDVFVFVSGSGAQELLELSDAARDAASPEEFSCSFLRAATRRIPFERLLESWNCDSETAIEYLNRIEVRTIGERDLDELIHSRVALLFRANPHWVTEALLNIIEDSVHRTVTREEITRQLAEGGYPLREIPEAELAHLAVRRVTGQYLEGERSRLIRGELVPRKAVETLLSRIQETTNGVLTGKAGAGKTACAVHLVEVLQQRKTPVLAFRLDRHIPARNTADLGRSLGLEESPVLILAAAAERAGLPGVLVVDQLDAVSTVSGGRSQALDLINSLLREATGTPSSARIHTVVVCRSFDWNHDHRLRKLMRGPHAQVDVTEFEAAEVRSILDASGFDSASFAANQLQLLRLPQNLYLFLESDSNSAHAPTFTTVKELFDRYWDKKRRSVQDRVEGGPDLWMNVVRSLCLEMTSSQNLYVRRERLDDTSPDYVNQMTSEGVLVVVGETYGFGHQSFFDYCFARIFVNRSESLVSLLVSSEQHLFRRAQVRQVLTYLRGGDHHMRQRYVRELTDLLSDERVRPHIKDLAFGFLADVTDPIDDEWEIWTHWIGPALEAIEEGTQPKNRLSEVARRQLWASRSWFSYLEESDTVTNWMESANDRLVDLALGYLRFHEREWPDRVAALLEPYLERGKQWQSRVQRVMEWGSHHKSRPSFEVFLRLLKEGAFDQGPSPTGASLTLSSLLHDLATERPAWCSEALALSFHRRLAIARAIGEDLRNREFLGFDRGAEELIRKCSEHAPAEFVNHLLPVVLEISDFAQVPGDAPKRDLVWKSIWDPNFPTVELAALVALGDALATLARDGIEDLRDVISDLRGRDTYIANFLLLALYRGGSTHSADEAISLLCREPWRFECGAAANPNWFAMETIREVASRCSNENRDRIQARILRYVRPFEKTATGYRYYGAGQFALLSAIPESLRNTSVTARFEELRRKFGEPLGAPKGSEAVLLSSPISEDATQEMNDDQWLCAIKKYRSEDSLRLVRGEPTGSAVELARVLEERTKEQPVRFANLSLRFPPDTHAVYLERILAALKDADLPSGLKVQVSSKAFRESIGPCGKVIADVLGSIRGRLPNAAVQMLHSLATESEDPASEAPHQVAVGPSRNPSRDLELVGINSTRGRAAMAIGELIRKDRDNIDRFEPTLENMIQDPSTSVRMFVAGVCWAVARHDSALGMSYFQRMDLSDDRLLSTRYVRQLMLEQLHDSFQSLRPLILRMLRSPEPSVCQSGSSLAGIAYLLHESAAELVDEAVRGGEKHRLGIAEVASANIAHPRYQAWCAETLSWLFDDDDPDVRAQSELCFRNLTDEPLESFEHLIESYCESMAFRDDPSPLLDALEESRDRLPRIALDVCERLIDGMEREGRSGRERYIWQTGAVARLIFRTYQQHQGDPVWACRSLDLIDRMCLVHADGAKQGLQQFER